MVSHACAACGKSITEAALVQGTAVEHSGRIYCATCASLIVTPGSMPVVGEDVQDSKPPDGGFEVLQEYKVSIRAPDIPSPFAVVEDVQPADVNSIEGAPSDMANDDDEWFKPRSGGSVGTADAGSAPRISVKPAAAAPAPVPVAPRPAAKSSGVSSRVGMKPAAAAPSAPATAPSTSGRVAPSSRLAAAVPAPALKSSGILEPKKSGRVSSIKTAAPASKSASRRGSAIRPAFPPAQAPEPEVVAEVVDEPEQDVVAAPALDRKGKSSRRMQAAKSSASARATGSSRSSKRDEREEKDGKKDKDKKKGAKGGDMTMIYGGVAAVVVLILIAVFAMGRGKDEETGAKAVNTEAVDKTPSGQYASQAAKELASGSRKEAMRLYTKASEQAEREGNSSKALNYNMKAMDLMKSSKLKDH